MHHPDDRRIWRTPDVAFLVGPCVRQRAVAHALEQPGRAQLVGRPLVDLLQPWPDHPVVEESSEAELDVEVGRHAVAERILGGQHPRQRQEDPGHPESRVAEQRSERTQPAERQPRRGDERVREQHSTQHDVHEEALGFALRFRQVAVVQVAGDDAPVVRPIPACAVGSSTNAIQWSTVGEETGPGRFPLERHRLAAVAEDALVDGTPPRAARAWR